MATFILDRMLWCPLSVVDERRVKEGLTVHSLPYRGTPEEIELFEYRGDDYIGVPRMWGLDRMKWLMNDDDSLTDETVYPEAAWPSPTFPDKGGFWDGQTKAIDTIEAKLRDGTYGCLLEAPPGTGKTLMGLTVASRLNTRALVLTHKTDLSLQWQKTAFQFFGLPCGHVQQDVLEYDNYLVTTASAQTLYARKDSLPDDFWSHFGLVIYDEGHRYPAKTFEFVLRMFYARYRLAVSATWRRADRLERVWHWHVGFMGHRLKTVRLVGKFSQPEWKTYKTDRDYRRHGIVDNGLWLTAIAEDPSYNDWLAEQIMAGADKKRKSLVVSDRISQLEGLRKRIIQAGTGLTVGMYVGKLGKHTLTNDDLAWAACCDIILATYRKAGEGTDIPALDTLFLGTPRADVEQVVGRVQRRYEGKQRLLVVDPVFQTPYHKKMGQRRLKTYKTIGFVEQ